MRINRSPYIDSVRDQVRDPRGAIRLRGRSEAELIELIVDGEGPGSLKHYLRRAAIRDDEGPGAALDDDEPCRDPARCSTSRLEE